MSDDDVALRPARAADLDAVVNVWTRSFTAALPTVQRAHDDAEVRQWFAQAVLPHQDAWVAVAGERVVGIMVLHGVELSQLYLDPDWRGREIGDRFIALAKQRSSGRLHLSTFDVNAPARRFYERHGFVASGRTDGAGNEEHEPDVHYVWTA